MNNISDYDGDVKVDESNIINGGEHCDDTKLEDANTNNDTKLDSFVIVNKPTSSADNDNNNDNPPTTTDDLLMPSNDNGILIDFCESYDNKFHEKESDSGSADVIQSNDDTSTVPSHPASHPPAVETVSSPETCSKADISELGTKSDTQSENESGNAIQHIDDINSTMPAHSTTVEPDNSPKTCSKTEKSEFKSKSDIQTVSGSKCEVCQENVYPMEKVILDSKIYHQNCFRCCKCKKALSPTVVSKSHGNLFCKPHYIELFRMRGKYDDIDINKFQADSAEKSHAVNSSGNNITTYEAPTQSDNSIPQYSQCDTKDKTVSAKDLAKRFQEGNENVQDNNAQRKPQIDIGSKNRVANACNVWVEGNVEKEPDFKRRNSNNNYINELDNVKEAAKGSVKNLKAKFEFKN